MAATLSETRSIPEMAPKQLVPAKPSTQKKLPNNLRTQRAMPSRPQETVEAGAIPPIPAFVMRPDGSPIETERILKPTTGEPGATCFELPWDKEQNINWFRCLTPVSKRIMKDFGFLRKDMIHRSYESFKDPESDFVDPDRKVPVSQALINFLNKFFQDDANAKQKKESEVRRIRDGAKLSRTEVFLELNNYIFKHQLLQNNTGTPEDKIEADEALTKLLHLGENDELTFFSLQRIINPHFLKEKKDERDQKLTAKLQQMRFEEYDKQRQWCLEKCVKARRIHLLGEQSGVDKRELFDAVRRTSAAKKNELSYVRGGSARRAQEADRGVEEAMAKKNALFAEQQKRFKAKQEKEVRAAAEGEAVRAALEKRAEEIRVQKQAAVMRYLEERRAVARAARQHRQEKAVQAKQAEEARIATIRSNMMRAEAAHNQKKWLRAQEHEEKVRKRKVEEAVEAERKKREKAVELEAKRVALEARQLELNMRCETSKQKREEELARFKEERRLASEEMQERINKNAEQLAQHSKEVYEKWLVTSKEKAHRTAGVLEANKAQHDALCRKKREQYDKVAVRFKEQEVKRELKVKELMLKQHKIDEQLEELEQRKIEAELVVLEEQRIKSERRARNMERERRKEALRASLAMQEAREKQERIEKLTAAKKEYTIRLQLMNMQCAKDNKAFYDTFNRLKSQGKLDELRDMLGVDLRAPPIK